MPFSLAPPGLPAPPADRDATPDDLPFPPLHPVLHRFIVEIYSAKYAYHISRVPDIIEDFLLRLRRISTRITCCIELDYYFRSIYRFLLKQPGDQRASIDVLHRYWEDYSSTSSQLAFDNACEDLRLAEEEHQEAHEEYRAALLSLLHREFSTDSDEYRAAVRSLKNTLESVRGCVLACEMAARKCESHRCPLQ